MSSSQRNGATTDKNSLVLEKEYMQVKAPCPSSANQGASNTGQGKAHKKFNMTSSPVNPSFHSCTNQVKQCTKEVETSAIGKVGEQTPASLSSYSGDSEKNMRSSQGLPSMDKHSLILEKDNTETNISMPLSTNQVMESSQTTETGSSNPRKVKRVRGCNKCKEVASLEAGKKLKITFYNNRTVGSNSNLFSRHLGKIIRDSNMCPLGVSSWNDIKQQRLDHMWAAVTDKFESDDINDHRGHIFGWMNELWNKWRGYLYETHVKNKPIVQALKNIPKGVDKKEWEWLVKEHFCSESFQGGKDGNPPNLATIFFETRKKDNVLVEPEAIEKHAQIEEILKVEPSLPSIEVVEKCCGPQNRSHVFGFGGGVKAKDMKGGTSSKAELLSELCSTQKENKSLSEENKSLNGRLSTIENEMKEIRKMQEYFAAQQAHIQHTTCPVSNE